MKTIEQLLRYLGRPDVAELALVSGRLPCVRIGTSFDPVDEEAPSADQILGMLVSVGGSRYVDVLGPTPKQWTSRLVGLGAITVSAIMPRDGEVHARFALVESLARAAAPAGEKGRSAPPMRRPTRPEVPKARVSRASVRTATQKGARSKQPAPEAVGRFEEVKLDRDSLPPPTLPAGSAPGNVVAKLRRHIPTSPGLRLSKGPLHDPMAETDDIDSGAETPRLAEVEPPSTESARSALDLLSMLAAARTAGATDLHVLGGRPMLLRIAGDLKPSGPPLDPGDVDRMLVRCVPERLSAALTEQGSCDFALQDDRLGRFRVNVARQQTGLKGTVRLIARDVPTLEQLGLPPAIAAATKHHQGLIVVTGPTGHGKTSTLAAIVDILNRDTTAHIITVEDPVEYIHPKKRAIVSQREIGTHTRSFAAALKASLREDPDIIVVGELRDTETVRMAVAASETGHLVLGTMNTPSAAKTIDRLIDLFPPADQPQVRTSVASGLRLIVSQRLVPSVDRKRMFPAVELLPGSVPLSAIIRENKTFQIPSLQQRGKALGIVRLDDSLAELVHELHVALDVARSYAESPGEFEGTVTKRQAGVRPGDLGLSARKGP
jgi:twitching motility protein PilT